MDRMFQVIGWTIVIAFIATTIVTLLALTTVVPVADPGFLDRLFLVLVLEIVAAGFFIFRWGTKRQAKVDEREAQAAAQVNTPAEAYFRKGRTLLDEAAAAREKGETEEADRLLGEILAISIQGLPFEIRQVFRERGALAFDAKLWQQAANSLRTYYEIQPDDLDALIQYGRSLRETNQYQEALKIYERAERMAPNNYAILNGLQNITRRLGGFLQEADRPDAAEPLFERARGYINSMIRIAPNKEANEDRYLNAILARARLYWQWERYPEAVAAYRKTVDEFPKRPHAAEDLAAILLEYSERGGGQEAVREAKELYARLRVEVSEEADRVFTGAGYAEAVARTSAPRSEELDDAEQAVLLSLAEIETVQEDPYPFYAAALLFDKKGQRGTAVEYLEKAIHQERRRASDPYRFDYVRLVRYERLLQRWTELSASSSTRRDAGTA